MAQKNVVVVGGSGTLGPAVVDALQACPELSVKILARPHSTILERLPINTTIVAASLKDESALVGALHGAYAVVSLVGFAGVPDQKSLIEASIKAGVKRFIPSEFSSDLDNPKTRRLEAYATKLSIRKLLEEKANTGKIEYTAINTNALLDWGLSSGFFGHLDAGKRTATLFDGGETRFSATLVSDVAKAIATLLTNPDLAEARNTGILIHSAVLTQKQLAALYEKILGEKFTTTVVDTEEVKERGTAKLQRGDATGIYDQIIKAGWSKDYGCDFSGRDISEKLGIKMLDEAGLENLVRSILQPRT